MMYTFLSYSLLLLCALFGSPSIFGQQSLNESTITNLFDAFSKDTSLSKYWGLSCIIKYQGKIILFDAGSNADIFKKNISNLGVDLSKVDIVVISHSHYDHLNGIDYLLQVNPKVKIYFPYDTFWGAPSLFDATGQEPAIKDSLPNHMQYFDGGNTKFNVNQSGRFWNANIEFVKTSKEIFAGLTLIFTSAKYMGYFSCYPGTGSAPGQLEEKDDDCKKTNLPELSLSMKTNKGQGLIVGCSHSGVENIVRETKNITSDKIELVYGGFHLLPFNRVQTGHIVNVLKNDLQVHRVAPAHCTGHLGFKILKDTFGNDYLYAGLGETITY